MTSITDLPIPVYHAVKDFKQNTETALSVGYAPAVSYYHSLNVLKAILGPVLRRNSPGDMVDRRRI
jgi:hypothetical protein